MSRARFLHTADLHLSRPFGFLPPQLAEERRRDQRAVLTKIIDLAIERDVDFLLVAGDLFDAPDPDPTDLEAVIREFSRLADSGKRMFAIPGNHDYATPNSFWRRLDIPGLHVFIEPDWNFQVLEDLGVSISGIAFDRMKSERRAFEGFEPPSDIPSIVLTHASYEAFEGQVERYHPFSGSDLPATKATYVALGHYHRFNPMRVGGVTACYPGTPEGISFDTPETEDRFIIAGEIGDDGGIAFETIKVNKRTVRSAVIDCTSFESQTSLFDAVRKLCQPNVLTQIKFTGAPTPDVASILDDVADRFKDSCLYLAVSIADISLPADLPVDDRTIRGRFCKHLLSQIETSADAERKRLLRRALELGIAAFSED